MRFLQDHPEKRDQDAPSRAAVMQILDSKIVDCRLTRVGTAMMKLAVLAALVACIEAGNSTLAILTGEGLLERVLHKLRAATQMEDQVIVRINPRTIT